MSDPIDSIDQTSENFVSKSNQNLTEDHGNEMNSLKGSLSEIKNSTDRTEPLSKATKLEKLNTSINQQREEAELHYKDHMDVKKLQGVNHKRQSSQSIFDKLQKMKGRRIALIAALFILGALLTLGAFFLNTLVGNINKLGAHQDFPNLQAVQKEQASLQEPTCSLRFIDPPAPPDIQNYGPVLFQWTSVPEAHSYSLEITSSDNPGNPWIVALPETAKRVYMENFPHAGNFQISVKALSGSNVLLCSATLQYNKTAYILPDRKSAGDSDGNGESSNSIPTDSPSDPSGDPADSSDGSLILP